MCLSELMCVNECVFLCTSKGNTSVSVHIVPDIPHPVGCPECNIFCREQITYNKHIIALMHNNESFTLHVINKNEKHSCHEFKQDGPQLVRRFFSTCRQTAGAEGLTHGTAWKSIPATNHF